MLRPAGEPRRTRRGAPDGAAPSGVDERAPLRDFKSALKQAQEMQSRLARLQEELAGRTVEASSGGGMVTVTANGRQEILSIRIEKEVISREDADLLQDLVRAAVNEALSRSREMIAAEMAKITGGMNLPWMP